MRTNPCSVDPQIHENITQVNRYNKHLGTEESVQVLVKRACHCKDMYPFTYRAFISDTTDSPNNEHTHSVCGHQAGPSPCDLCRSVTHATQVELSSFRVAEGCTNEAAATVIGKDFSF